VDETVLYNYARRWCRDEAVSHTTYAATVAQFGKKRLIDLVATLGF
jgi:hypothetical protein